MLFGVKYMRIVKCIGNFNYDNIVDNMGILVVVIICLRVCVSFVFKEGFYNVYEFSLSSYIYWLFFFVIFFINCCIFVSYKILM